MEEIIAENMQTLTKQDFLEAYEIIWDWNQKKRKRANVSLLVFGILAGLVCLTSFLANWMLFVKLFCIVYLIGIAYACYIVNNRNPEKWAKKLYGNYLMKANENEGKRIFYEDRMEKKEQGASRTILYEKIAHIQLTQNLLIFILEDSADGKTQMGFVRRDGFTKGSAEKVLEAVKGKNGIIHST